METINDYLAHLTLEGKRENTIATYRFHLRRYREWLRSTEREIGNIRPIDLLDFKKELLLEGKAERSVNGLLSCVKGYYEYLILTEVSKVNPASDRLRIRVHSFRQDRLTDAELDIFYSHIDEWKENIRAAFYLMASTGARVGEVANLRKGDFRLIDDGLYINIIDAKWQSDRLIPVTNQKAAVILKKYLDTLDVYEEPAFRVSKRTLQTHATNFQTETGIPFRCHVLRHTFATLLLEDGIPLEKIQYMLGHKTPGVTRHYTQSANIDVTGLAPSVWQGEADE